MALSREQYRDLMNMLAPPGRALPQSSDTNWQKLTYARAGLFQRVDARADLLVEEADPRTAYELLPDYERAFGLPDPCVKREQTVAERRAALLRVLTGTGGASRKYFKGVAADLGYDIEVEDYTPYTVADPVDKPIYGLEWRWTWTVRAPEQTVDVFTTKSTVSEPLATWGNDRLECVISRLKPAHTLVLFAYGEND
jgi:uncharacterized protein YmfQ (DUF2313 family)